MTNAPECDDVVPTSARIRPVTWPPVLGAVFGDPAFIDVHLRIVDNRACDDLATATSTLIDFYGVPRAPIAPDIGAYEWKLAAE